LVILLTPFLFPAQLNRGILIGMILVAVGAAMQWLMRRGFTRLASVSVLTLLWLFGAAAALTGGGVQTPDFIGHLVLISMAGLLLGGRAGAIVFLLVALEGLAMVLVEAQGLLPPREPTYDAFSFWVVILLIFAVNFVLQQLAARAMQQAVG